jgi:hypothetical protein
VAASNGVPAAGGSTVITSRYASWAVSVVVMSET